MIVLKTLGIIVAIIIGIVILVAGCIVIYEWVTLPFSIRDYFKDQNRLIEEQTQELKRLNETISKSSKN